MHCLESFAIKRLFYNNPPHIAKDKKRKIERRKFWVS